ncbi:MAG: phosphoadenylyl-sulfate reductase [Candidatus Omnitrophica bacterium]|nr:phosphoadenylyl-sulfate reductase [Candidatus Omnitrophota bacterium]
MEQQQKIIELNEAVKNLNAEKVIEFTAKEFPGRITFASSLGEEDQVITDMLSRLAPLISVFTLDTGRLYQETYDLLAKTQKKYHNLRFQVYFPEANAVENMVQSKGINLFYESVENRKLCCGIRKVEPLKRALAGVDAWIVGLRKDQAVTRGNIQIFEWDEANHKIKVNPLADWTLDQVRMYIKEHNVDVNPLHEKGFMSIGCAPCTRAIKPGEDIRAGRWWWEAPEQKECGLHNNPKWAKNRK